MHYHLKRTARNDLYWIQNNCLHWYIIVKYKTWSIGLYVRPSFSTIRCHKFHYPSVKHIDNGMGVSHYQIEGDNQDHLAQSGYMFKTVTSLHGPYSFDKINMHKKDYESTKEDNCVANCQLTFGRLPLFYIYGHTDWLLYVCFLYGLLIAPCIRKPLGSYTLVNHSELI